MSLIRGQRPGAVHVRRGRRERRTVTVRRVRMPKPGPPGPLYLVYGFAALIGVGTIILLLPISTASGAGTDFLTALFTATSAVCVTGLVVVDTGTFWSPFGQAVILVLFLLGGLGFMTSSTLLLILFGRRLSMHNRLLAGQTLGQRLSGMKTSKLVRRIVIATLAIQLTGAVLIMFWYARDGTTASELWRGFFTAISAFNNAGFDIEGGFRSLSAFRSDTVLLFIIAILVGLGGLGYAIWSDVARERRWRRLAIDTKLVLVTTASLLLIGALVPLVIEIQSGRIFANTDVVTVVADSLFMSVVARTAGFSVVDIGSLSDATLFLFSGLMFIGGASASTAGGIKVGTFAILILTLVASLRGRDNIAAFRREIPRPLIYRAIAIVILAVFALALVVFLLDLFESLPFIAILFESVSAIANVGLSTGITPELSDLSRITLVLAMFIGRLGPLTVAVSLAARSRRDNFRYAEEDVNVG